MNTPVLLVRRLELNWQQNIGGRKKHFDVISVRGDENYFFRCLSFNITGTGTNHQVLRKALVARELKSREVAQRQKNNVISGFIRSLALSTSTLAPRGGWSGALQPAL